jgi:hypothetical protein
MGGEILYSLMGCTAQNGHGSERCTGSSLKERQRTTVLLTRSQTRTHRVRVGVPLCDSVFGRSGLPGSASERLGQRLPGT